MADSEGKGGGRKTQIIWGAFVTVLVTIVTTISTCHQQSAQNRDIKAQLFTELTTKREQAESDLRKDMFTKILESFLGTDTTGLESLVLKLELLSYNFHGSLDLKPLFMHIDRRLRHSYTGEVGAQPLYIDSLEDFRRRLVKVAREVKHRQVSTLSHGGGVGELFQVWKRLAPNSPDDTAAFWHRRDRCECCELGDIPCPPPQPDDSLYGARYLYHFCNEVEGVRRRFAVQVSVPLDLSRDELEIEISVMRPANSAAYSAYAPECIPVRPLPPSDSTESTDEDFDIDEFDKFVESKPEAGESGSTPQRTPCTEADLKPLRSLYEYDLCVGHHPVVEFADGFNLWEYDFPMIDNVRLSLDHRFALVMKGIGRRDTDSAYYKMCLVCFPGSRAGLKDRPYYDDIVRKLIDDN